MEIQENKKKYQLAPHKWNGCCLHLYKEGNYIYYETNKPREKANVSLAGFNLNVTDRITDGCNIGISSEFY